MTSADAEPVESVLTGPNVAHRVVRGGIQRAVGFGAINIITAAGAVLLLRHLGVRNFGRYGTVMALITIVQGISDAGLSMTGSRELSMAHTDEERRHLLAHLVGLRIILSGIGVVLAVAFSVAAGYPRELVEGTALTGGAVFLLSVQSSLLLPLVVDLENWRLAINDVLRQLVLVVGFVILVIEGASLLPFFAVQLVAAVVVLLMTPLLLHRGRVVRPKWDRAQIRLLTARTLPLAISGVLSVLYFRILVILMSLLEHNAVQVGFYVTSARVIEVFLNLPVMLVGVVLPVLSVSSRDDAGRLNYVTLRLSQTMMAIGVLLAVIIGTGAHAILLIVGGQQYVAAAPVMQIQCIALITIFLTGAWTTTLVGMGRTRELAIGTAIGLLGVALLGLVLIPAWAAEGAAVAAVAGDIVFCIAIYVPLRRSGAASAMTLSPFARLLAAASPGLAIAIAKPLPPLANCLVATLLFAVLIFVLRAVPPEIESLVRSAAARARHRTAPA